MSRREDIVIALSVLEQEGLKNLDFVKKTQSMLKAELDQLQEKFPIFEVNVRLPFPSKMIEVYGFETTGFRNYQRFIQKFVGSGEITKDTQLVINFETEATLLTSSYYRGLLEHLIVLFGYEFGKRIIFNTSKSQLFRDLLPKEPSDYMN